MRCSVKTLRRPGFYESPQGPIEELLADIWSELLKCAPPGRHSNFFQLGG